MVDVRLQQYIQEQLKMGYSNEQIRATLLQSGYTTQDITAATPHSKILVLAILLCISIAIVFSVLLLLRNPSTTISPAELTGELKIDSEIIRSGEPMYFTLALSQSNIRIRYSVLDNTQREVTSKEELVQTLPVHDSIVLPYSLSRGSYVLTARLADTTLSVPFTVAEKGSLFRLVDVSEGVPSLKNVTDIARKSSEEASVLCSGFADVVLADKCHLDAALATDNDTFCTAIQHAQQKDSCYFNIVFSNRQLELCKFIQNPDLEVTCSNL